MKFLQKYPVVAVFILALAVRLVCLAVHPGATAVPTLGDASRYHGLAEHLLAGDGLIFNGHRAQVSPGYPLFIAGIYAATGHSVAAVLVVQCLLGALLAVFVLLSAGLIAGKREGVVAGIATALYWPFVTMNLHMLSETLFLLLMVAGVYLLLAGMEKSDFRRLALSAAVFGLAALTRPVILYFLAVIVAALLFDQRREPLARRIWTPAAYLLIVLLVMLPWAVRNKTVLGELVWTNTNTGQVLLTGNTPRHGKFFGFDLNTETLGDENAWLLDLSELERDRAFKKLAIERLTANPGGIPRLECLKFAYLISPFDWEMLGNTDGSFNPWFIWIMLFGIPGLFLVRWRWPAVLVPVLIAYFVGISMVTYASPRLRLPIIPYLIIAAAAGWTVLEQRLASRVKISVLFSFVALSCVVGYHYSTPLKNAASSLLASLGLW